MGDFPGRRAAARLATAVLGVTAAAGVTLVLVWPADRPRDETTYVHEVKEFLDGHPDNPRSHLVTDTALVAEGDRACDWLSRQPPPRGRAQGDYESYRRYGDLLRTSPMATDWPFGPRVRSGLTYDAWSYLCADVASSQLWQPPPGDEED